MSDMFDHEGDAWDQAFQLSLDGQPLDEGYFGHSKYTRRHPYVPGVNPRQPYIQTYGRGTRKGKVNSVVLDYQGRPSEEDGQPEFQQLIVSQLHRQTEKSYCVSGVVHFATPYRGMKTFEFLADWVPKKCCFFTGNTIRIPQWLIKARLNDRRKRYGMFDGLIGKTFILDIKTS